ncbi:capsular exopolysaccharide family [Prosthecobacter debontii]|uniref:Capsular exopolysaccharide family n=1 Tax=Prosthecobacter debontii TaxID=48467 RepID=A0A1T4YM65_9BACT|nr:polysaccharide biosynthesis tyrosine autokinase [Prosthecobacter debontii]SKB02375.1 capsular exopolysaccharide family [Prosthecobacter debontii]
MNNPPNLPLDPNLTLPGAIPSSNLNRIHETSAKFQRYKLLLARRWWFLLLTASIGVCVQALLIMNEPVTYTSLAKLVAGGRMVAQGDLNWQETMQDFYGTIIETLESADLKKRTLTRVQALHPDLKDSEVEIKVTQTRGSAIFNVFAIGAEQKYTQIFLEALLDEFVSFRQQIREQGLERALNTFTETVVKKSKELQDRAAALEAFRKANNIVTLNNGNNEAAALLSNLTVKKKFLEMELNDITLALQDVDNAMSNRERGLAAGTMTPAQAATAADAAAPKVESAQGSMGLTSVERDYLETRKKILRLESERVKLLKSFKAQHPMIVDIDEEIEAEKSLLTNFQQEIVKELRGQQADLERRVRGLEQQIAAQAKEAVELGGKLAQHERLEKEFEATKLAHDRMFERVQEFQQLQNVQTDYVAIQEHASLALKSDPEWVQPLVIGLVVGLVAGGLILLVFDRLDDRMNSFAEFQSLFPNEAVLGQVPEQRQRGDVKLLQPNDDRHLYAEAFRNIRSSILFKNWQGQPPKTILVTSAVPNEGKTTVTSNLAITLALGGARVLLADCDLRRGGVNELFKQPVSPGLSEVLRGGLHWRDAVQETPIRNLHLLPRGAVYDQTSEMLLSKTAEDVLHEMGAEYDYVVFDSAPVLVADDTGSFAPKIDTVLFVVRMSSTMARLSGKALDLLYERQVNVGGVILNRASTSLKEYTYYNYASYYYTPQPGAKKAPLDAQIVS